MYREGGLFSRVSVQGVSIRDTPLYGNERTVLILLECIIDLFDLGVIWTDVLRNLVQQITNDALDPYMWTDCKFPFFVMYLGFSSSSALLVIISVEKFIGVYFPQNTTNICTVDTARKVSLVTAVIFVAFNSQFFFMTKKYEDTAGDYCYYGYVSWSYLSILFSIIFGTLSSYGPFVIMIMISINSAIIFKFMVVKLRNRL